MDLFALFVGSGGWIVCVCIPLLYLCFLVGKLRLFVCCLLFFFGLLFVVVFLERFGIDFCSWL